MAFIFKLKIFAQNISSSYQTIADNLKRQTCAFEVSFMLGVSLSIYKKEFTNSQCQAKSEILNKIITVGRH